jgi:hypothetical protein
MPTNFGEQSGPNNLGVREAQADVVAFLNHDDFYLPNHLRDAWDLLRDESVEMIICGILAPQPMKEGSRPEVNEPSAMLFGISPLDRFTPEVYSPASGWVLRKSLHQRIGGFRPAVKCSFESSQDFLFRAWRAGARQRMANRVSVLAIQSGARPGSYAHRPTMEHEHYFAAIQDDRAIVMNQLLAKAAVHHAQLSKRTQATHGPLRLLRLLFSWLNYFLMTPLGIHPRAIKLLITYRSRSGFIKSLRITRGLETNEPTPRARKDTLA